MMKMLDNADNAQCITNNDKESKCQAIFFLHFDILLLFVFFPVQKINFPMTMLTAFRHCQRFTQGENFIFDNDNVLLHTMTML